MVSQHADGMGSGRRDPAGLFGRETGDGVVDGDEPFLLVVHGMELFKKNRAQGSRWRRKIWLHSLGRSLNGNENGKNEEAAHGEV